jgi:hypothetical protein
MDKITQENAALAEESSASAEELKSQAEQVRLAVAELMRMARGSDDLSHDQETETTQPVARVKTPAHPRRSTNQFRKGRPAAGHRIAAPVAANGVEANHDANGENGTNGQDNVDKFFA